MTRRITKKDLIKGILMNAEEHCSACLAVHSGSAQPAAQIRGLRNEGYQIHSEKKGCVISNEHGVQTHYKLISRVLLPPAPQVLDIPDWLVRRVWRVYRGKEVMFGRRIPVDKAIVDHKVSLHRMIEDEPPLSEDCSKEEIMKRYQLLARVNTDGNLYKSRHCEKCFDTGIRQGFMNIGFFFEGNYNYDNSIGCVGCPHHDYKRWFEELAKFIETVNI